MKLIMNERHELLKSETKFETPVTVAILTLSLFECLKRRLLISPDTRKELIAIDEKGKLTDGVNEYTTISGCPILYPK